jgi:hypothetical protein
MIGKLFTKTPLRVVVQVNCFLSDITLATLSNNLKSVGFSLSKQIGIDLKSTGLFLVKVCSG